MQDLLKLSIFFVLLTTGASLTCEVCSAEGYICNGTLTTCPPEKDTCMIAYSENTLREKVERTVDKDCVTLEECANTAMELYFGPGKALRTVVSCCNEKMCGIVNPNLPPLEMKWNGKQCPACHEWSNTCKDEVVNCTGANIYCFDISAHVHSEKIVDRTLKGCTSKSFCLSLKSGRTPMLGGSDELRKAECSPNVSRGAQCSDLFLPTFSGLLLLKILS
ncbi:phospholipase A2 inhibitor and Ly6/PLAUR domain-containing protein-like isoform X2 [Podarcis raffonei]|uniref:phospholipase A2 inhibitor and Ly6/PLAUR domain-containing protein-like isoform X2 n=1 Tax=Podarcis raffonei TaxID=65483 RepID=UPI00232997AE|nr:phospholipase A2 inhibitor and Ly6/PLAUR domain-containing protein-like isoform X2 [Podarcis raffonei]XP_053254108.1 phospholipase A2 inhibitor and Ly6/PLAUR domain-containing protein-like isoform X2 [Podarcis raffonei]